MARNNMWCLSFRLNVNNPVHVNIAKVINNLDKKLYKSKNQFIIDACEYYINHYGSESFMDIPKTDENSYVKREEFTDICEKMKQEAAISARDEVIKLLGSIVMNSKSNSFMSENPKEQSNQSEEPDDTLIDLVASWDDM